MVIFGGRVLSDPVYTIVPSISSETTIDTQAVTGVPAPFSAILVICIRTGSADVASIPATTDPDCSSASERYSADILSVNTAVSIRLSLPSGSGMR